MARPKVFVVQPIMEVGVEALAEFADAEIFQSERMITRSELLRGIADSEFIFMLGDTPIDEEVDRKSVV